MRMAAVLLDGDHLPEPGSRELLGLLASLKPRTSLVYLTFQDASRVPPLAVPALVRKPCDPPRLLGVLRELCTAAA